jgi:hypothetical protein
MRRLTLEAGGPLVSWLVTGHLTNGRPRVTAWLEVVYGSSRLPRLRTGSGKTCAMLAEAH